MNKNVLIVFAGAIAIAVVVAMLVQVSLGSKKKVQAVAEAKVEILVAAKDLKTGQELKEGDIRWQEWPKNGVFPGAVTKAGEQKPNEAVQGRLARSVSIGEPVMQSAILGQAKGNFVAANLQPGQRAMAVEVSASSMVGGFIEPGDFVDIILTYKQSVSTDDESPQVQAYLERNLDKYATETILQNVKVLAIDQSAKRPEEEKVKVGKTVTVAVNALDAERLSLASELGELNLVLRGVGDDQIIEKSWPTVSDARLTTIEDEIYEGYNDLKKGSGLRGNSVRIYRGDQISGAPAK